MLGGRECRSCALPFMEISDEKLLKDCRSGDQRAWETLVNRYQRLIYAVARRAGLDADQAAEVFQEVFTTLLEKLDDITQPERLHAWLVTTARRKTWRLLSRESRWQRHGAADEETEDELEALPDNAALPDEALMQLEEQHRVRRAVAALDERCRKLLTLLFYSPEPLPYEEVARAIGAKEGSIGPTRARCLQKLMRQLEN
jgi:RNA polymerase sigma factor (sigma-70 family)